MAKLLFVVHRYAPFAGGSEYNTQRFAEACVQLNHDVTVFAITHKGDLNGVKVTDNPLILQQEWDLIIVHGDGSAQNIIHTAPKGSLKGKILYLLIRPDDNLPIIREGMEKAHYIGCATSEDFAFVKKYGYDKKIQFIHYPVVVPKIITPREELRKKFDITSSKVYMSSGGFWPHKGFDELLKAFIEVNPEDSELILTGYDARHGMPDYTTIGKQNGVKVQMYYLDNPLHVYELMRASNWFVWNSKPGSEGYGLVLLECIMLGCSWIGRDMAAASKLAPWMGVTYTDYDELKFYLKNPPIHDKDHARQARELIGYDHNPERCAQELIRRIYH